MVEHAEAVEEIEGVVAEGEVSEIAHEEERVVGVREVLSRDKDRVGEVHEHDLPAAAGDERRPSSAAAPEVAHARVAERIEIDEIEVTSVLQGVLGQDLRICFPFATECRLNVERKRRAAIPDLLT